MGTSSDGTEQPASSPETVTMEEWSSSPALSLSEDDLTFIRQRINEDSTRLGITHTESGKTVLESSRYVGVVSLPDGPPVEIQPKSAGENFLRLFQYANGLESHTVERRTEVRGGPQFLDAIAALYTDELATILQRGIATAYKRTEATEEYLKGQIDVQQQLQRQGLVAQRFECRYDDLTPDTTINQAILYAASVLKRLVTDKEIQRSLERQETRLRRAVSLTEVSPQQLADVEVTRLDEYYRDALRLAELVIRNTYVENIRHGARGSFGLLLNMDEIFEAVVERAIREAATKISASTELEVEGQANVNGLVTGGSPSVSMYPDFVVRDRSGTALVTGDAKWKTNQIRQSDIYQLTAYQLADRVPGTLVYPQQGGSVETEYVVQGKFPMVVHELPTAAPVSSFEELCRELEQSADLLLRQLLPGDYSM